MTIARDAFIIGLTGSFGSGCSTLMKALQEKGFKALSLSKAVHEKWQALNPRKQPETATRKQLQDVGNDLRKEKGNAFLAENAVKEVSDEKEERSNIVFDSIRHPDEIAKLRDLSRNCFIIAIGSSLEERWNRLKDEYERKNLTLRHFEDDDLRDADEDIPAGQKVQLCVDSADISVRNEEDFPAQYKQKEELWKKTSPNIDLLMGNEPRPPSPEESMMSIAYNKALSSSCYKRQVGAVIHDENGTILGVGCNENPPPLDSCYEEWGECFRDVYKKKYFSTITKTQCPSCHEVLESSITPDYKCKKCDFHLDKHFFPDRAISRCTAVHAEESAIMAIGSKNLEGCTIFTTAFPCFSCAQKIVGTGIKRVVYCEAYPDPDSARLFEDVNKKLEKQPGAPIIRVHNFEGIKARAYFRVFGSWRGEMERRIDEKRGVT